VNQPEERFGRVERRQLWARDTRLPPSAALFYLERGEAKVVRPECQSGALICPVPDCPSPRYSTRGGSKRDHFFHVSGTSVNHAPESWFHFTAKHLVGDWLRRANPGAEVHVDDQAVDNGQRPDVLATLADGRRFAFEVQYAGITAEAWLARHDGYRGQGITDIWLFGHAGAHFRPARGEWAVDRVLINPAQAAVEGASQLLHWINPDERTIASRRTVTDLMWQSPFAQRHGRYAVEPLSSCRLGFDDFMTPTDTHEAELKERRDSEERAERELEERIGLERAAAAAKRRVIEDREEAEYRSQSRPQVVERLGGAMNVIEVHLPADRGVWRHPFQWHAELFELCIEGHVGETFTMARAAGQFRDRSSKNAVFAAVASYLRYLKETRYVDFESEGYWVRDPIRVLADSTRPPGAPTLRRRSTPADRRWTGFRTEEEWAAILDEAPTARSQVTSPGPSAESGRD
jgi:hypothetical protein